MRLVLCAVLFTLLGSLAVSGCSDDDYNSSANKDGSATSTDAGSDAG